MASRSRGIDVELLKSEIKRTYACVSDEPERDFIFPTGRAWAEDLGYPAELASVPDGGGRVVRRRREPVGAGPARSRASDVLDLGSGAGTDSLVAAQMVGADRPRHRDRHDAGDARQGRAAAAEMGVDERRVRRGRGRAAAVPGRELRRRRSPTASST